jgi:hypothetical protein
MRTLVPALTVLLVCACARPAPAGDPAPTPQVAATRSSDPARFPLPDVNAGDLGQAAKILQGAGLVVRPRYVTGGTAPAGQVLGTEPRAGTPVAVADVVVVDVADPLPDDAVSLPVLVGRHPEVFVGFAEEPDGTVTVAANRGADLDRWRPRLEAAARGTAHRIRQCAHTWTDLARIQALLSRRDWSDRAAEIRFATSIDARTCSVRLASVMLTADEMRRLTDRFGDALTIDPTSDPRRGG